ncbi:hypothetical protein [Streptomyces scopuliridis]|uniref:Uncharacterized protein n=1 Tax=Streptomyces scopuliridis RB72 TaxID=1440053 RepID=A0A2T7SZ91_9ACTN|nr:hypothetical protein [Streptomyces scopuliridis]PVE08227.1 hypothetical protein Y717_17900 [Streptomyces scopuliridis RB72]
MTEQSPGPAEPGPAVLVPPPLPPMPPQPPVVHIPAPRPPRRVLRAVARWTAAVVVFAGLGTGAAYGISSMERSDVPGLATRDDGRWDYPRLSLPALPSGSPRPFTPGNTAEIHHADLRELLLPAPAGATGDKKLAGGWVSTEQYVSEYAEDRRAGLRPALRDYAVRHIAARGWTMPDGTSSRVYLLRFQSGAFAQAFKDMEIESGADAGAPLVRAPTTEIDEGWSEFARDAVEGTSAELFVEPAPYDGTQVRQAYVVAGDTLALIVHEKKGGAPAVPFRQTVILQNQLLG